ncbi:hypothetical protein MHOCP_01990 [Moorella humiferrea]|uniref:hypothetical protein n=1 Tax=Neomoorella humiferrea TaxID=676965 RepID=UPI0030CF055F
MPYAGLMTLIAVAVIGILFGVWRQRQTPQAEGRKEIREEGRAGETPQPPGLDSQLIAVIAAAVVAHREESAIVWTRLERGRVNPWVLSGRQELHNNQPSNRRWR